MPTPWKRDLEADGKKFAAWLQARLPDARDLEMSPLVSPTSSGFSNETLLFDLAFREGGERRAEKLVVRIQPVGFQVFPEYDLGVQFRTMQLLEPSAVPVPRMFWYEKDDDGIFGAPFYVMQQVAGRVPPDQPPYHTGGWVTEIAPAARREIFLSGFEVLARLHQLDYRAAGFGFLDRPEFGAVGIDQQLGYYDKFHDWASRGRPHPVPDAARAWLRENQPDGEPLGVVWGDARIGNMIFDGTRPAAVLDWEMVTLGSPEVDVGWMVFLDRHHSEGIGTPRLEGFPSYEECIAHFERLSGHRVRHLHYYEVFAGYRFAAVMMRIAQQLVHYELMDDAAGYAMEKNNTVTQLLAKLLDLPAPGETGSGFGG